MHEKNFFSKKKWILTTIDFIAKGSYTVSLSINHWTLQPNKALDLIFFPQIMNVVFKLKLNDIQTEWYSIKRHSSVT